MIRGMVLLLLVIPAGLAAQRTAPRYGISSILSAGMAAGESDPKFMAQWSGGLTYKHFFAGIGSGVDMYRFKSIPLFADLRADIGTKRSLLLYAQAGYNFPVGDNVTPDWRSETFKVKDRFTGGFYMDAGIGFRFPGKGPHRFLLSAGYSRKKLDNEVVYDYQCTNCSREKYMYKYDLGRVMLKVGWEWRK